MQGDRSTCDLSWLCSSAEDEAMEGLFAKLAASRRHFPARTESVRYRVTAPEKTKRTSIISKKMPKTPIALGGSRNM